MHLTVSDLSMRYGARRLFERLSFEVAAGEPIAIVGANGSGKSTLLRILSGVLSPIGGKVVLTVDGRAIPSYDRPRHVGMVTPDLQLYEAFTARENLEFLAAARGLADGALAILNVLERVDLADRADDPLSGYSTGMKQRMRIAAALLHEPPLLLLDEPGATLDEAGRALVESVAASDAVVLLATNDPREADLCPRRLTLGGRIA